MNLIIAFLAHADALTAQLDLTRVQSVATDPAPVVALADNLIAYETTPVIDENTALRIELANQREFMDRQIERIYDRIQAKNEDVQDSIDDAVDDIDEGISFATVALGGTGLSSGPSYGQILVGNASGGYTLTATSALGISSFWTAGGGSNTIYYSSGNVGIGTSTPISALAVVGTTTIQGTTTLQGVLNFTYNDGNGEWSPINITAHGDEFFFGDVSNGNVGLVRGPNAAPIAATDGDVYYSTLIGYDAGGDFINGNAIAIGYMALANLDSGYDNLAIGANAMVGYGSNNTQSNTVVGNDAMRGSGAGVAVSGNTVMGYRAMDQHTLGDYNTAIGYSAQAIGRGNRNTSIGYNSGYMFLGSDNNVLLGAKVAENQSLTGDNNIGIGYDIDFQSLSASNQMTIGNLIFSDKVDGTGTTVSIGSIGIGTTSPTYRLHVSTSTTNNVARFDGTGGAQCTIVAGTGDSCTSDERLKKDLTPLTDDTLEKVLNLNPLTFKWKSGESDRTNIGFSAQELEDIFPELVFTDASGYKSVTYAQLTPLLAKAIQQQHVIFLDANEVQDERIEELESKVQELEDRLNLIQNYRSASDDELAQEEETITEEEEVTEEETSEDSEEETPVEEVTEPEEEVTEETPEEEAPEEETPADTEEVSAE